MEGDNNLLYVFHAIARLTCPCDRPGQQLHSRRAWMLIGKAGTGVVSVGPERYTVCSGGAVIGGPGSVTLQAEKPAEAWELLFVEFVPLRVSDEAEAKAADWTGGRHSPYAGELGGLAERLYSVVHLWPDSPQRSLTAHILVQQMLLWWLNAEKEERSRPSGTTEQAVLAALRYMESHFAETLTREQLAAKAGIAHTYFSVLCKKLTGLSPSVYLERLRTHRAAELLLEARDGRGDLDEIARHSGFRDPWYMSRRFRNRQGTGPSAYRADFVPERPASLQYPYTHHLMALGILPSAARFGGVGDAVDAAMRSDVVELPRLLSIESLKERLRAASPHVILTYDGENVRERLRVVAPVVHIPWLSMNWREHMKTFGRLFHKEAEAAARIEALDRQAAATRRELHDGIASGTKVSIFKIVHERCFLYGVRDAGCIFYEFLGFSPHPYVQQHIVQDPNFHSVEIAMHQMADFAGDLNIVFLYPDGSEQSEGLRMNEHWRRFEVAAGDTVVYLDYREWLHYDPIHMAIQLREIAPILLKSAKRR